MREETNFLILQWTVEVCVIISDVFMFKNIKKTMARIQGVFLILAAMTVALSWSWITSSVAGAYNTLINSYTTLCHKYG